MNTLYSEEFLNEVFYTMEQTVLVIEELRAKIPHEAKDAKLWDDLREQYNFMTAHLRTKARLDDAIKNATPGPWPGTVMVKVTADDSEEEAPVELAEAPDWLLAKARIGKTSTVKDAINARREARKAEICAAPDSEAEEAYWHENPICFTVFEQNDNHTVEVPVHGTYKTWKDALKRVEALCPLNLNILCELEKAKSEGVEVRSKESFYWGTPYVAMVEYEPGSYIGIARYELD